MCRFVPGFTRYCMFFYSLYHLVYIVHSFVPSFVGWFSPSLRLAADTVKSTLAK